MSQQSLYVIGLISMILVAGMTPVVIFLLLSQHPYNSVPRKKVNFKPNFNAFWSKEK